MKHWTHFLCILGAITTLSSAVAARKTYASSAERDAAEIRQRIVKLDNYKKLSPRIKKLVDGNRYNYSYPSEAGRQQKIAVLYRDNSILIAEENPQIAAFPQSLKDNMMAAYEPSPALDKTTGKPYFSLPEEAADMCSEEELAFLTTFLEIANENYHFLTAYPLLKLESKRFRQGDYDARSVPGQWLLTGSAVPRNGKNIYGETDLRYQIQCHIGYPLYDAGSMDLVVSWKGACSNFQAYAALRVGPVYFHNIFPPFLEKDELQDKITAVQKEIRANSLEKFKNGLESIYDTYHTQYSEAWATLYTDLKHDIREKLENPPRQKRFSRRTTSPTSRRPSLLTRHATTQDIPVRDIQKIRAE